MFASLLIFAFSFTAWLNFRGISADTAKALDSVAPNITAVSPNAGLVSGGETITITGSGFAREQPINPSDGVLTQASFRNRDSSIVAGEGYSGSDAIDLVGSNGTYVAASNADRGVQSKLADTAYWSLTADFTNYDAVSFYARHIANYGLAYVCLDGDAICATGYRFAAGDSIDTVQEAYALEGRGQILFRAFYNVLPTDWTQYQIDLSGISGAHTLYFIGGYIDLSGGKLSETQYSDITLIREMPTVTIGGAECANVAIIDDETLTCTAPAGVAGLADVAINDGGQIATLAGGYEYVAETPPVAKPSETDNSSTETAPVAKPTDKNSIGAPNTGIAK